MQAVEVMIVLPSTTMYIDDILHYVKILGISNFISVFMSDELPDEVLDKECGILNLQPHTKHGSHWNCWLKNYNEAFYFDSFSEPPDVGLKIHLSGYDIKRSAITVQRDKSKDCGALCINVIYHLWKEKYFSDILYKLQMRWRGYYSLLTIDKTIS